MIGWRISNLEYYDNLKNFVIVSQLSPPKIPQLSGIAERRNQILFGMVRSIMSRATLLISLWGYS